MKCRLKREKVLLEVEHLVSTTSLTTKEATTWKRAKWNQGQADQESVQVVSSLGSLGHHLTLLA